MALLLAFTTVPLWNQWNMSMCRRRQVISPNPKMGYRKTLTRLLVLRPPMGLLRHRELDLVRPSVEQDPSVSNARRSVRSRNVRSSDESVG